MKHKVVCRAQLTAGSLATGVLAICFGLEGAAATLSVSGSTYTVRTSLPDSTISYGEKVSESFFSEGSVSLPAVPDAVRDGAQSTLGGAYATAFGFTDTRYPEGQQSKLAFRFGIQGAQATSGITEDLTLTSGIAEAKLNVGIEIHDETLYDRVVGTTGTVEHVFQVSGHGRANLSVPQTRSIPPAASGTFFISDQGYGAYGQYEPADSNAGGSGLVDSAPNSFSYDGVIVGPTGDFVFGIDRYTPGNAWVLNNQVYATTGWNAPDAKSAEASLEVEWLGAIIRDAQGVPLPFASFSLYEQFQGQTVTLGASLRAADPAALLIGDYDGNGQAEQGDLNLVLNNWGQAAPFEPNGAAFATPTVDQEELNRVLNNWGASAAPTGLEAVNLPEPGAFVVGGLGLAWTVGSRRRSR
ncbi:MAG: hypothetical protein AAF663_02060 [Planctomycetota bacterium]